MYLMNFGVFFFFLKRYLHIEHYYSTFQLQSPQEKVSISKIYVRLSAKGFGI